MIFKELKHYTVSLCVLIHLTYFNTMNLWIFQSSVCSYFLMFIFSRTIGSISKCKVIHVPPKEESYTFQTGDINKSAKMEEVWWYFFLYHHWANFAILFVLFVCSSVVFRPTRDFFIWDITIAGEELHILTYARHSWPLNSEGFFKRPTPTVTRDIRLLWSSPRTRDTHTYCRSFNNTKYIHVAAPLGKGWPSKRSIMPFLKRW